MPGFAISAFILSQWEEIGADECVSELSFESVFAHQMAFLQPAIHALKTGDPDALLKFDDLLLPGPYRRLQSMLGKEDDAKRVPESSNEPFEEEAEAQPKPARKKTGRRSEETPAKQSGSKAKSKSTVYSFRPNREDPLSR